MKDRLKRRLGAIERRQNSRTPKIQEVVILGGLSSGIAPIASFGGPEIRADPDETFGAFRARVHAIAENKNAKLITFGGLPTTPFTYEYAEARDDLKPRNAFEYREVPDEEIA